MPDSAKAWVFTINNYTDDDKPLEWDVSYVVYQKENAGTPHLQGYVELAKRSRLSAMKKIHPTAHWEIRRGTQEAAINYATKRDDTYVAGPWEKGEKAVNKPGKRNDLAVACEAAAERGIAAARREYPVQFAKYHKGLTVIAKEARLERLLAKEKEEMMAVKLLPWQQHLADKLEGTPDPRKIHWYWESEGNVGKSYLAKWLVAVKDALLLDCSKRADLTYLTREHTGTIILFNIVRTNEPEFINHIYGLAEAIKDDAVISTKYETTRVPLGKQHVVVFANTPPDMTKWSADRYDIHEINMTTPFNYNGATNPAREAARQFTRERMMSPPPPETLTRQNAMPYNPKKRAREEPLCPNGCEDDEPCFCAQKMSKR